MDLPATQPCHDYDEVATQNIELDIEKKQNVQIGVLIVNSNSYPIYKGINNIGRNSNCQIHLEDQSISKYHAEIEGHTYPMVSWISDLNSCNKTILNNIVLRPKRYYELKDNSTIQFGRIKAIYKSCHLEKEFIIPETPEHIKQNNVTAAISESSDSLLSTYTALNGDNCIITAIQECPRKSISLHPSTNQLAREILKNRKSKYNVSKEINDSAINEQNDRSTSYESEDIFDAATQHVNIDSYLESIKDSSLQKEINNDENVDIDNTTAMEQIRNTIGSMSTPIKKTNNKVQLEESSSIERDIASATKRIQSKNESSHLIRENSKKKGNNIDDFNESETQLICCLSNFIPNGQKDQIVENKNDIDNMETLNTQIIDFSGFDCDVNRSGKQYKENNDTDIYPLNTQIINMKSNNHSASAKKKELEANTIGTTSNSSIEDVDYETASTQIIGEMKITNGRTFKLATSNFQTEDDDDILSRLPEVTISGTLSNSSISVPLVTKLNKSRQSYDNKETAEKSGKRKTRSTVKNTGYVTDVTMLSEHDKGLNKMATTLISENNRLNNSMDKRMGTKEKKVSVKGLTYKPEVNTRNKKNKKNINTEINKKAKRNTRSMTNKEQEAKNEKSNLEMGEESQEVAMIMKNSLINDDRAPRSIRRKRKIASTNLNDDSLNNSNIYSRKSETNNVQYKVSLSRVKENKLSKNNASQSSLDSMTDDNSLAEKDKDKDKNRSTSRKSSFTRSRNTEKQINENNTISSNKRRKKNDLLMDVEINIRTSETRKCISHLSSNTSFSTKERILFTGITDDEYVKILKVLGGIKVDDPSACTILVTDKIRRTTKFLCTLAKAVPIVSVNWLHESKRVGYFLDWNNYLLKDPVMEAKYGFRLRKSLEKARERQLLDGYIVLLTPNIVSPPIPELKAMITSCGGKAVSRAPPKLPIKTIIISHENDLDSTRKWLAKAPKDVTVQSTEFLLTGILKQELDFVRYKLI